MLQSYVKIAFRNLFKNKTLSFINITGLALGMTGAALLLLNLYYDYSIDRFHEKRDRIYRVYNTVGENGRLQTSPSTPAPLGPALKSDYPEILSVVRTASTEKLLSYGDKKIIVEGKYTDPSFLDMFSFPLVEGNASTALSDAHSMLITEDLAKRLFGTEDPVNKNIQLDNTEIFTVTGIMKNLPGNTHFSFDYLLPWGTKEEAWNVFYASTYVELPAGADYQAVNSKIEQVIDRKSSSENDATTFIYPFAEMGNVHFRNGKPVKDSGNTYFLSILAAIILIIACINFMNLSTARSQKRAREVGVRKVMGAVKRSLVFQFIGESILMALLSGSIALLLIHLIWPTFSRLAKVYIDIPWQMPFFWLSFVCFVLFTGILAGSYPAFYLSSFKPVKILKGVLQNGQALVTPRKILVITQFVFAIVLINATIIIKKQINHGESRETGFVKENLVFHKLTNDLHKNFNQVQHELLQTGTAVAVSQTNTPITRGAGGVSGLEWQGSANKDSKFFGLITTNGQFVSTNGLALAAGRDIDIASYPTDTAACLLNETAVAFTGLKNPVGSIIREDERTWKVVGVVKDFFMGAPGQAVNPVIIRGNKKGSFINIRLNPHNSISQNARNVERILKKYNPGYITEIQFADDDYKAKFQQAKNASKLINSFAFIAIFISCLGLYGLAMYMAENRSREIGIRRVLGASVTSVTTLLTKEFIKLVTLAIIIASPLAWLFMNFFLQQFAYRTAISWWILLVAGITALAVAILTVIAQTLKAAVANPVNALRTE